MLLKIRNEEFQFKEVKAVYSDCSDSEDLVQMEKGQGFCDINQILGEYIFDRKELGKQPLLCYIRLPRHSHDISLRIGGKLVHNVVDFEDLRKTFFTMRRSELGNLEDALKRQYREHNFGWPGESRQLKFSSLFEGGNLQSAIRSFRDPNTYFLEMIPDSNSVGDGKGHFHFKVENAQKGATYTFVIANFDESNRLLDKRKACVWSAKEYRKSNKGWMRSEKAGEFFSNRQKAEVSTFNADLRCSTGREVPGHALLFIFVCLQARSRPPRVQLLVPVLHRPTLRRHQASRRRTQPARQHVPFLQIASSRRNCSASRCSTERSNTSKSISDTKDPGLLT